MLHLISSGSKNKTESPSKHLPNATKYVKFCLVFVPLYSIKNYKDATKNIVIKSVYFSYP